MKKIFDRYLFSRMGLQILFSVILILIFSWLVTVVKNVVLGEEGSGNISQALWGFRQFVDSGVIVETIDELDEIGKKNVLGVPVMMVVTLLAWLMGIVLCGFVTGAIVNAFDGRRDKIATGKTRYKFSGHGIVIGWDDQGVGAVRGMLDQYKTKEVIILSTTEVEQIQTELSEAFSSKEQSRIYIYNGVVGDESQLRELFPQRARAIVILGDDNAENNDGSNLCIANMIDEQIASTDVVQWFNFWVYSYVKCQKYNKLWKLFLKKYDVTKGSLFKDPESFSPNLKILYWWWTVKSFLLKKMQYIQTEPIDCYVDISNDYSIDQLEKIMPKGGMAGHKSVNFKGFNFCREAILALLGGDVNLAFRHNPEATKIQMLISGFNGMSRALIKGVYARMPSNMELGVKIFAQGVEEEFNKFISSNQLSNVSLVDADICSKDVRSDIVSIVRDITSNVNIFLFDDSPDGTLESFCRLPDEIARENIQVFIEQRTFRKWSPNIKRNGFPIVRKFGFLDEYQKYLMSSEKNEIKINKVTFTSLGETFKEVIGVFNGRGVGAHWKGDGNTTIYKGIVNVSSTVKIVECPISKWHLNKSKRKSGKSEVAFLLSLSSFASFEVARMAYEYGVAYVLVLPKKVEDVLESIDDELCRTEYARLARNAYSLIVEVDPDSYVLENSNAIIVKQADVEVLKSKNQAMHKGVVKKCFVVSDDDTANMPSATMATVVNNISEICM